MKDEEKCRGMGSFSFFALHALIFLCVLCVNALYRLFEPAR
jgi:hypothetical protein